jgi:calcium channel MID1
MPQAVGAGPFLSDAINGVVISGGGSLDGDASHGPTGIYVTELEGQEGDMFERAPKPSPTPLHNNFPFKLNVEPDTINWYMFPREEVQGKHGETGPGLPSKLPGLNMSYPSYNGHEALELRKRDLDDAEEDPGLESRQNGNGKKRTVYLTANTCLQPLPDKVSKASPPQLTLYVSTNNKNKNPGPRVGEKLRKMQKEVVFDGGYASFSVRTGSDVYFGIYGPSLKSLPFHGVWNTEVAASIDAPFHTYNSENPFLFLVDSDTTSALLVTNNLTSASPESDLYKKWMDIAPPFKLFAVNLNDSQTKGVQHSYCGLSSANQIAGIEMESAMITRGLGNKPKEQFHITGLNGSSTYYGLLAMDGNSTASGGGVVSGGGQVWNAVNFTTKADNNCQVIYDLQFCSEVAYAVPSNPELFSNSRKLAAVYDANAKSIYKNFSYSLQQIPCDTTSEARYSLARNCEDCARDYKNWLCAVSVPRCEDFSASEPWLQPRNIGSSFSNGTRLDLSKLDGPGPPGADGADSLVDVPGQGQVLLSRIYANSSRNPLIDKEIKPGPYKEVLPCEDLCYSLVQSCPASFGFRCPLAGKGLERSYGRRSSDGRVTCSYLGAVYYLNDAKSVVAIGATKFAAVFAAFIGVWLVL